jgi:hypothetical protein
MPARQAQLLLFIGTAIASGVLGNAAWELMRNVLKKIVTSTARTPYLKWKIGDVVTEDEAGKLACQTLALYRKSLGFDEDEQTYRISSITLKNHGWDAEISLSDRDAMPYRMRIGIEPNEQGPDSIVAELW